MQDLAEQAKDKAFLRSIAANEYELPADIEHFAFAQALIPNFHSSDAELRDELSYIILARGIIGKQKLTTEQIEALLHTILDSDHLFYNISEVGTDAVFMRSFSNLLIAAVLYNNAINPTLSQEALEETKAALLHYAQEEKDWRGYVEGKGWAHAVAHLADALDEYAQSAATSIEDRKEILNVVSNLATLPARFSDEEDVRLANVAYHIILGKQLDDEFLTGWVNAFAIERTLEMVSWVRGTNAKNFLRSLYFFLHWDGVAQVLAERISLLLKKQEEMYVEKTILE